jgi:hypothetical protein
VAREVAQGIEHVVARIVGELERALVEDVDEPGPAPAV